MANKKKQRFEVVFDQGSELTQKFLILADKETGVQYLLAKSGYGAGLTPLLDKDGKPLLYHLPIEEAWD